MTKTPTVIIGFAEALAAPEVAWSLVEGGFKVVAFSRRGRRAALRASRLVKVFDVTAPEIDSSQTHKDLRDLISSLYESSQAPVAVMPIDDCALWLCGRGVICDEVKPYWSVPKATIGHCPR